MDWLMKTVESLMKDSLRTTQVQIKTRMDVGLMSWVRQGAEPGVGIKAGFAARAAWKEMRMVRSFVWDVWRNWTDDDGTIGRRAAQVSDTIHGPVSVGCLFSELLAKNHPFASSLFTNKHSTIRFYDMMV